MRAEFWFLLAVFIGCLIVFAALPAKASMYQPVHVYSIKCVKFENPYNVCSEYKVFRVIEE